jgi:2-oxoglutarate ferredoxin oxidoreductase subunit delta
MNKVTVDTRLCKRCGICSEFCPTKVFTLKADQTPVPEHVDKCTGCRMCELRCPDFAITVEVIG